MCGSSKAPPGDFQDRQIGSSQQIPLNGPSAAPFFILDLGSRAWRRQCLAPELWRGLFLEIEVRVGLELGYIPFTFIVLLDT